MPQQQPQRSQQGQDGTQCRVAEQRQHPGHRQKSELHPDVKSRPADQYEPVTQSPQVQTLRRAQPSGSGLAPHRDDPGDKCARKEPASTPVSNRTQELGRSGEDATAAYLEGLGWRILERNWRCRDGEIDIIAADGLCLVIVEVKSRASAKYGRAAEAVTAVKLQRLRRLGAHWAKEREVRACAMRVDVIGWERSGASWTVDHRRGVRP